jgi:hypothetical protein
VLEPPTWFQGGEDFLVQHGPVADGAVEAADVNEVEGVGREGPLELGVFDLKAQVGRDPAGLGGGDVDADDFGGWVFIGDVSAFLFRLSTSRFEPPKEGGVMSHCVGIRSSLTWPRCRCLYPRPGFAYEKSGLSVMSLSCQGAEARRVAYLGIRSNWWKEEPVF